MLLDSDDAVLNIKEIYMKVAEGRHKCSWESFEAYRHLKLLGYIVGRHCVPWTNKANTRCDIFKGSSDKDVGFVEVEERIDIIHRLKNMQIHDIIPTFDVYLPNSKFRKSSPGKPNFLLCLLRYSIMFSYNSMLASITFTGLQISQASCFNFAGLGL